MAFLGSGRPGLVRTKGRKRDRLRFPREPRESRVALLEFEVAKEERDREVGRERREKLKKKWESVGRI